MPRIRPINASAEDCGLMAWADRPTLDRAALAYCAPRGIPLSVFLGRVVYPGDPVWLPDDTLAALDWQEHEATKCPGCGQPRDESMAHEDDSPPYEVTLNRCQACKAAAIEVKAFGGDTAGLYPLVRKAG